MSQIRWIHGQAGVEPQKLMATDVAVVIIGGVANVLEAAVGILGGLTYLAKAHANYRRDKAEFDETIRNTIERL